MRDLVDELLQAKVKTSLFGGDHAPRIGRLVILDRLGSGAMGTVFTAYDPKLDRKVAVKLVRGGGEADLVIKEARALARLDHPNVVAVHDVLELDGEVSIVMELAPGVPLRTWIGGDRDWPDVVRVMTEAAAGLAAAHRAGLVHRDIKPDNLLIGEDRTRVVDFGLAHDSATGDDGRSAGTPSYMAPEALDDEPATEASDQFSFGVTLYEALYGVRPHTGRTRDELKRTARTAASARPGKSTPPEAPTDTVDVAASTDPGAAAGIDVMARTEQPGPDDTKSSRPSDKVVVRSSQRRVERTGRAVRSPPPAWLHAIAVRALAADPAKRFPSMTALAAALGRDRRRRRAIAGLVAGATIAGAVLGAVAYRHQAATDPCSGGPARRETVWSTAAADRVRTALGKTAWAAKAVGGLDATATTWEASYRSVCEASRVRGGQSDTLLDLRMRCLDRALDRFGALATALSAPLDTQARAEAAGAVADLPRPEACETISEAGELALPADPAKRARVTAAEKTVDRAWAAYSLGQYRAAGDVLRELGPTEPLGSPALDAAALVLDAAVEARIGQPAAAHALLETALSAAAKAHAADLEAEVWARLLRHELFAGAPQHAIEWAPFAHAAAVRAGREGAEIDGIVGEALRDAGRLDEARVKLAAARASKDPLRGDRRALIEVNIGSVELAAGSPARAEEAFTHALALATAQLGEGHPSLAIYIDKLAAAARARGRIAAALALNEQSLAVRTQAYGADDRSTASSYLGRARTLLEANRLDEATADAARAEAIRISQLGATSARLGEVLVVEGDIAVARGDRAGALALYTRAGELDRRLDLAGRRFAAGGEVALDTLPTELEPLTADRASALAARMSRLPRDKASALAEALRTRFQRMIPPVDPAIALPLGEALQVAGDRDGAAIVARAVLDQLATEPSRSRERAQRLLDASLK